MKPYYKDLHNTLYCADFRRNDLADESVQCVVTSPPYWGLRKYSGEQELIWGDKGCEHRWSEIIDKSEGYTSRKRWQHTGGREGMPEGGFAHDIKNSNTCSLCGAWKGAYGLEPTPEMYIEHTIEILREIRRVLRKDGVVWWNIGDSYYGGGFGTSPGGNEDFAERYPKQASNKGSADHEDRKLLGSLKKGHQTLKPKDLCLIPFRVAIAAQEDGWWVRSVIIWNKPNPMPESVHGSHFIRHYVTIEEYERLSGMRSAKGSNKDGPADLLGVSQGKISDSKSPLSEQSQRAEDREGLRTDTRSQGETPSSQSFTASQTEQGKAQTNKRRTEATEERSQSTLLHDSEGQGKEIQGLCQTKESNSPHPDSDGRGLARDIESSQEPLSLLPQEESPNDRPRNSNQQGREAPEGEHSPGLSELQRQEKGQSNSALVECPGCPKCKRYNGYIRVKGSGRPTESHEYILMLTKSDDYFFDTDAVRESSITGNGASQGKATGKRFGGPDTNPVSGFGERELFNNPLGRNIRSVWEFPTQPYPEAHFAVFPEKLPEICIKAATPEVGCCSKCGSPWERITENKPMEIRRTDWGDKAGNRTASSGTMIKPAESTTLGWQPTCKCNADKVPSLVLDPFLGAGTVAWVAKKLNRRAVGYEISEEYVKLAVDRCRQQVLL